MKGNRQRLYFLLLSGFVLFHSACAQNPPLINGRAYVQEERLAEQNIVLLNNEKQVIPLQGLDNIKIASIHFTTAYAAGFDSLLNKYMKVDVFNGLDYLGRKTPANLEQDTRFYNTLIVQLTDADLNNPLILNFIINQKLKNVIVAFAGSAVSLAKLNDVSSPVIWSARVSPVAAYYSAQVIFGGVPVTQKLIKTYSPKYIAGYGFLTNKIRLQYTVPEAAGVNTANLTAIDDIAHEAIAGHATPGCVVLVAKDGKVIFNKAYGAHTYDNTLPDKTTDIFDIASMTKISATTMETMRLYDLGKINLDSTAGTYLALARNTNKNALKVREILEHQAGLIPDIPTFDKVKPTDHSIDSSAAYPTRVNDNYFLRRNYFEDVMWPAMLNSPVKTRGQYVYSDLSMCFMQQIVETIGSMPLNIAAQKDFYDPLGMQTAGYLPLKRFPVSQIPPTEDDRKDRHTLIDGDVHDPTAALMGGVAGHAGLFASANDLAIMYQMMLSRGLYGGIQYIKPETVDLFTAKQSAVSRRGLGFDRWDPIADRHYPSRQASDLTYGHTGFTGTCVWVDPKYNLVYIFLSNRVYPNVGNKLSSLNIRPRIQDAIYEAIEKGL